MATSEDDPRELREIYDFLVDCTNMRIAPIYLVHEDMRRQGLSSRDPYPAFDRDYDDGDGGDALAPGMGDDIFRWLETQRA